MNTTSAPLAAPSVARDSASASADASAASRVAAQVREVCMLHGIDAEQLSLLLAAAPELRQRPREAVAEAARGLVGDGAAPDLAVLRASARVVGEDIGHGVSPTGLERPLAVVGRRAGDVLGAVLA